MPTNKEIDKKATERLFDLLLIKRELPDVKVKALDSAIIRAKLVMTSAQIAWVESLVAEEEN